MIRKELAKIEHVYFGFEDGRMGIHYTFSGSGWGIGHCEAFWADKRSDYCQWTEKSRIEYFGDLVLRIAKLLTEAKVKSVDKLKGIPVEVTIEGNCFREFRILTEVL